MARYFDCLTGMSLLSFIASNESKADWQHKYNSAGSLCRCSVLRRQLDKTSLFQDCLTAPAALNTAGAASPAGALTFAPTAAGAAFNLNMETKAADTLQLLISIMGCFLLILISQLIQMEQPAR